MKANELRIGNLFKIDANIYAVTAIHDANMFSGHCVYKPGGMTTNGGRKSPIPLTPEILEKCGFWYKPGGISGADMWQGMGFWYRVKELPNQEFLLRGDFSRKKPIALKLVGWFNSNIEYIHQLQNLYFSLTGEELEVKL